MLPSRIFQVSILRKRSDANIPCDKDLHDEDLQLREKVVEEIGCIPVYWGDLKSTTFKFETCNTTKDMKEIWNTLSRAINSVGDESDLCLRLEASQQDKRVLNVSNILYMIYDMSQDYGKLVVIMIV